MILALLAILILGPFRPDPTLTPGVVRPLTMQQVCAVRWGKDRRFVTLAMRKQVFAAYRIPYDKHALYELDHLVPRSLSGADDVRNLWPEPLADAHVKDKREWQLSRDVCAGRIALSDAQAEMKGYGR